MEDIEVIRELEKLLRVKSEEISLVDWDVTHRRRSEICYAMIDGNIKKIAFEIVSNRKSLDEADLIASRLNDQIDLIFELLGELKSLTYLDFSGNDLKEIPESISKLTSLEYLDLLENRLTKVPEAICNITTLNYLDLTGNEDLQEIPESITNLTSLNTMGLSFTRLREIPESITRLTSLKSFNFAGNELKEIPESFSNLISLTDLILLGNHLQEIPESIAKLTSLESLDLSDNRLQEIPDSFSKLISLTTLRLSENQFEEIPEAITKLKALDFLELSGNKIKEIPKTITKLTSLRYLILSHNEFKAIPENIFGLTSLIALELWHNQITEICKSITNIISLERLKLGDNQLKETSIIKEIVKLPALKELVLSDNPLSIPKEILGGELNNCLPDLQNYFQDGDNYGWSENNEFKILLIGNGGTGKTSLVNRLVHDKFNEEYKSTHGIHLIQYKKLKPYIINIWDFAGQDIYHATHKIFMQTRALFLVLWDAKTEELDISKIQNEAGKTRDYKNYKLDYWLDYVKVLGKGSHALVVQTKSNEHGIRINPKAQELFDVYKNVWIENQISIDSKVNDNDLNGFKILKAAIKKIIKSTDILRKEQLPTNWVSIKQDCYKLLEDGEKSIDYNAFLKICSSKGALHVNTVLNWLVESGVVFYWDGLFNNKIIINQQWVIDAVYTLFDREKFYYKSLKAGKGYFDKGDLEKIWFENSPEERELFLSFMLSCEICYRKDNGYIAPKLLEEERPKNVEDDFIDKETYFVKYPMPFFQYSIMQNFLVRLGKLQLDALKIKELWQFGILFKYKDKTFALVEAEPDEKQITVRVSGQEYKSLLDKIRNLLEEVQSEGEVIVTYSFSGNEYEDNEYKLKKIEKINKDDTFELEAIIQRGVTKAINENPMIQKIDKTTQDTLAGVELIIEQFSDRFSQIKQGFSFKKHDEEARINQLNELIDKHSSLLQREKNQRLMDAKEKAKEDIPKFLSLQPDSQTFIAMGFYFSEILPDNGDFSPAALQFCRALELEMKNVFIAFKNSSFRILIKYPLQTPTTKEDMTYRKFREFIESSKDSLALGDMVHIIDDIPKYPSHALFSDFGKFMNSRKSDALLKKFLTEVQIFKGKASPRNKSAHTEPLSVKEALHCKKLVIGALNSWL